VTGEETAREGIIAAARRGDLRQAARLAEAAASEIPPGAAEAAALANIRGGIAFERGQLELAEACFEETIRLASERGDSQMIAKASSNLGSIAHLRGKGMLAVALYLSALEVYRNSRHAPGEAQTEHNLSVVQRNLGELDAAQASADRAIIAARRAGDDGLLGLALAGAAEAAIERGATFRSRRLLVEARRLARKSGDRLGLVEVRRLQALLAFRSRSYAVALRYASAAYLVAHRLGSIQLSGECAALSAQASASLQRLRLAAGFRSRAHECFRSLGALPALRRLALLSPPV
jgi:tetratricopeptide (TPR) repeat protein